MKKNEKQLQRRRQFIKNEVDRSADKTEAVVNRLAEQLFLSPITVWKDLAKAKNRY